MIDDAARLARIGAIRDRVRAVIGEHHPRLVDTVTLPVRARIPITREQHLAARGTTYYAAIYARAGGEALGERVQLRDSVFGWQPDFVRLAVHGGAVFALQSFGALPGDGVDAWVFLVLHDELVCQGSGPLIGQSPPKLIALI